MSNNNNTQGTYTVNAVNPQATGAAQSFAGVLSSGNYTIATNKPKTYLVDSNGEKVTIDDLVELAKTMEAVKERLLILTPMFEKHEKYPALKQAYEHYKLLEKLIGEDNLSGRE